jgi:hypothetical protein
MHVLDNLSLDVRTVLIQAGWRPGGSRSRPPWWRPFAKKLDWNRFRQSFSRQLQQCPDHCAIRIVDELFGIEIQTFQVNRWWALQFDPGDGIAQADDIFTLGQILNECLIPIGETPSEAIVLLSCTGNVFLMGWVAAGVFSVGKFDEAVVRIIKGRDWQLIPFNDETDPEGIFTLR